MSAALPGVPIFFIRPNTLHPTISQIVSPGEKAALQRMVSVDRTGVEQLATSISLHQMVAAVNTLLQIHDTSQQFESESNGVTVGLIAASTVLILFIFYYFTQAYWWNVVKSCAVKWESTESESVQKSQCNMPPLQPNVSGENEELPAETQARFSAYSMQTESCNVCLIIGLCNLCFDVLFYSCLLEKYCFE
jgi:hypothetical protein